MTSKTDKLRAVFLTALMIGSVFAAGVAFSGGAAADAPSVDKATNYNAPTDSNPAGSATEVIELGFDQGVNNSTGTYTVYVDGEQTQTFDATNNEVDEGADGQIVLNVDDVYTGSDVVVNLDGVEDTNGDAIEDTNVTVRVASTAINANETAGTSNTAYQGEYVAVDFGDAGADFDITTDDSFVFEGNTGARSQVYVFSTADRNTDATYYFDDQANDADGSGDATLNLRSLGLSASAQSTDLTTEDELQVDVSANAGNRDVEGELLDENGDTVATESATLDGSGEATINFGAQDAGNYTVEVTDLATDTAASTDTIEVTEAAAGQATFGADTFTVNSGDIGEITIQLENSDTATVNVGSEDIGYLANVTVEDGNGDGEVVLEWNTYQAGNSQDASDHFTVADSEDEIVSTDSQDVPSDPVDTGTYDLEVRTGEDPSADAQGLSVIAVEERSTDGMNIWTAPQDASVENIEDVQTAADEGTLTQDDTIAEGDWLVHEISASGLEGVVAAQDGSNTTAQFLNTVGSETELTVEQTNPGPNREAQTLQLSASNTQVIADADNDFYYVLVDTSEVDSIEAGNEYETSFTVLEQSGFVDEEEEVNASWTAEDTELNFDDVEVNPAAEQQVAGTTTLAAGTEVRLRLQSTGDTQPRFIKSQTVTVQQGDDGNQFNGTFDFSEQEVGDTFSVRTSARGGDVTASADGEIVEEATPTPAETPEATPTETETPEATPTETETAEPTPTEEPTEPETATPTEEETPGFGIVVALVALIAAALLAVRRKD